MSDSAQRDPKQIRLTVFILIAIMLASGVFITRAYFRTLEEQNKVDRPPVLEKLTDRFAAQNQDGENVDTGQLSGKVWLATSFSTQHPGPARPAIDAMRRAAAAFPEDQRPSLVLISVDPQEESAEDLKQFAEENELNAEDWWLIRSEETRKFIRARLQLTVPREASEAERQEGYGSTWYDPRIVLVDPQMRLRGYYDTGEDGRQKIPRSYFDFHAISDDPEALARLDGILAKTIDKSRDQLSRGGPNYVGLAIGIAVALTFIVVFVGKQQLRAKKTN